MMSRIPIPKNISDSFHSFKYSFVFMKNLYNLKVWELFKVKTFVSFSLVFCYCIIKSPNWRLCVYMYL